jgi:hypothetical protein
MKRKEVINELSRIRRLIKPGTEIKEFKNKIDDLICNLKFTGSDSPPEINVTVNVNYPLDSEGFEKAVEKVIHKVNWMREMGRL